MNKKVIVVAGVSGSGKSTIGKLLAERLDIPYEDADDYHPQTNIDKMAAGKPLDDSDRKPWLDTLAAKLEKWSRGKGAVLACSALKEQYRQVLSQHTQPTWVFLEGSQELLQSRLGARKNHFFSSLLLQSQLDTFESPEYGIHVSIEPLPEAIVDEIVQKLQQ